MKTVNLNSQKIIKAGGQYYKILIPKEEILLAIKKIAQEIHNKYCNSLEQIVLMPILRGGYETYQNIAAELTQLNFSFDTYEVQIGRYSDQNNGHVPRMIKEPPDVTNRVVIFIDDLIDNGDSVKFLYNYLSARGTKSIECCVLIAKIGHRPLNFTINYSGFRNVVRKWLGGFGMNIGPDDSTRNFEDIYVKISKLEAWIIQAYLWLRKIF